VQAGIARASRLHPISSQLLGWKSSAPSDLLSDGCGNRFSPTAADRDHGLGLKSGLIKAG